MLTHSSRFLLRSRHNDDGRAADHDDTGSVHWHHDLRGHHHCHGSSNDHHCRSNHHYAHCGLNYTARHDHHFAGHRHHGHHHGARCVSAANYFPLKLTLFFRPSSRVERSKRADSTAAPVSLSRVCKRHSAGDVFVCESRVQPVRRFRFVCETSVDAVTDVTQRAKRSR